MRGDLKGIFFQISFKQLRENIINLEENNFFYRTFFGFFELEYQRKCLEASFGKESSKTANKSKKFTQKKQ